mgnify:CR=1 FL=1
MILLKDINKDLKSKLAILLKNSPKCDITIETLLDNKTSTYNIKVLVDNITSPTIVQIIQGTFIILAGDTHNEDAKKLIKEIPSRYGIQPTSKEWIDLAKEIHKENLKSNTRFRLSSSKLDKDYLKEIIHNHQYKQYLKEIDMNDIDKMFNDELQKYHFFNYNSGEDFLNNSFGFCINKDNEVLSACTACLLSKKSAEISIITSPNFRKKGLATLVAAKFILYCLENNLIPHWDAANLFSRLLAEKLGYEFIDEYKIYYLK